MPEFIPCDECGKSAGAGRICDACIEAEMEYNDFWNPIDPDNAYDILTDN